MKFSNKYSAGKTIKKQGLPDTSDYWLKADAQKKSMKKSMKKRKSYISKNDFNLFEKPPVVNQKNLNVPVPQNTDSNTQEYTGVDKKFQFNNNMMNMYSAAVKNADKKQNIYG